MREEIEKVASGPCELLAVSEPAHPTQDASFGPVRNELFAELVGMGYRSIALETDRVAGFLVDDYVRGGAGSLDAVMAEGFSHGFGAVEANRELVEWMREWNSGRADQVSFHGFDLPTETVMAPHPARYLQSVADYLGLGVRFEDDERWSRTEAVMDASQSPGRSPEAVELRVVADELLTALYRRAPELVAASSQEAWYRARTQANTALGLLRYHRQSAEQTDETTRISGLLAVRDVMMAQNLLDLRTQEERRGQTLVCAQNAHLQRDPAVLEMGGMTLTWQSAGAIVGSLIGERYAVLSGRTLVRAGGVEGDRG
ncbi:erythromycin esterase family protein [Kribbella sp. NPDC051770]|uniref:erythromycin esterase family protein n=1 Tax=Kribbella sp. NPDC051770 TaxID=3155413 RepID=UPI0034190206